MIVIDVTVWDNVTTSTRPLFVQSVQNAWKQFLPSLCTTSWNVDELDFVYVVIRLYNYSLNYIEVSLLHAIHSDPLP